MAGGKTNTSTSSVQVPPDVLARYNAVNSQAQQTAQRPFQVYSTSPDAFVAPMTPAQNEGVWGTEAAAHQAQPYFSQATDALRAGQAGALQWTGNALGDIDFAKQTGNAGLDMAGQGLTGAYQTGQGLAGQSLGSLAGANASSAPWLSGAGNAYANASAASNPLLAGAGSSYLGASSSAQPYNAGATNYALAGGQAVNPEGLDIGSVFNPYLSTVLQGTAGLLNQQNQRDMAGQLGNSIRQGAFGGDRAGLAAANLAQQQRLANASIYSGILDQGFNTALGAAQQQQGVKLGAAEANRAATQQTGQSLLGIGQQDYTQGMGLGSALQGLGGQLFSQGLSQGQAEQGLGAQVFGQGAQTAEQQAALGQQQFGQGLATAQERQALGQAGFDQTMAAAQARAGLGQQIFGIDQATSSGLAGLGAGAQTANLQGAQAELGAGQVQQQTQQAGLTALYNQFLQQQSYPFQVSQFLANIAEGTGALSGSTTTTTQPGGLFSDRRLKEGVEPIGKTYDGQNIVKFRYKGDPTTRIGLIAQDVEKHHPDAVGLAGGFRTVDYDEATRDAAKRGHFRSGGLAAANDNREQFAFGGYPMATGTDGPSFADILTNQARMYAPLQGGGLYGSSANAAPMGGSSYVPAANLPVSKLVTSDPPSQRTKTPIEQANDIAALAGGIQKGLDSKTGKSIMHGIGLGGSGANPPSKFIDPADIDGLPPFASGGLARGRFAQGGDPYKDRFGPDMDIPDEAPDVKALQPPQPPGQGKSSLGDIASLAKTAAQILPMFLARGGVADESSLEFDPVGDEGPGEDEQSAILKLAKTLLQGQKDQGGEDNRAEAPPGVSSEPSGLAAPQPAKIEPKRASEQLSGLPDDLTHTLKLIAKAEGTAKNPKSSARGPFQIVDPTFVSAYRQMFPDRAAGMSRADILSLRSTPEGDKLSAQMGPWLARQNAEHLEKAGIEPTPANIYLAHFLGADGATRLLNADPSTPTDRIVSPLAISENRSVLDGKSAQDVRDWAQSRLEQVNRYAWGGRIAKAGGGELDDEAPSATDFGEADVAQTMTAHDAVPAQEQHKPSFWENLKKPEVFIPILSGLATMATAPTQHFGTALAAGVGSGAQAYQHQREFALEQMQKQAQARLMGSESAALGLRPSEVAIRQYQAYTDRLNAQMQAFGQSQQVFDSNYSQLGTPGPDGFPMYMNRLTGERLTQSQYSAARNRYLQSSLSGIGASQGLGPLNAASTLTVPQSGEVNGSVPGGSAPGRGGADAGDLGSDAAGAGAVRPVPGHAGAGPGPVGPAVAGGQGAEAPTGPVGLAQKLQSGAYLNPSIPLPGVDNSKIADSSNPALLMEQGRALQQNGQNPEIRAQGQSMIERSQRIMGGQEIPLGKDGQPFMGYVRLAQARDTAGHVTGSYAGQIEQQNEGGARFSEQFPQNMQILNSLRRIYAENDPGRLTGEWADLVGKIKSTPWLSHFVTPKMQQLLDAQDEATKDKARQQIVAAVSADMANKAPAAALRVTGMAVPNPSMGAGARYNLVAQLYAQQQLTKDFYRDWSHNKGRVMDVSSYVNDWTNEHPISAYEKWAYDHITPFPGMTQQEMLQHPRKPKSPEELKGMPRGIPFIIPSGPSAGKIGWTQ